jgi:hypothetical protein
VSSNEESAQRDSLIFGDDVDDRLGGQSRPSRERT